MLDVVSEGDVVRVDLEAPAGSVHELTLFGARPASIDGGEIAGWTGSQGRVRVAFPAGDPSSFGRVTLRVRER